MSQDDDKGIRCQDACGQKVANQSEAEAKAWTYLEITKRYRCPACRRVLDQVNQRVPADE